MYSDYLKNAISLVEGFTFKLPNRIWRERDVMYLTHPATNFTLGWDGLTVVTLTMSKTYAGRLCGLCGDVGVEFNEVEDPQSHASSYEVDR